MAVLRSPGRHSTLSVLTGTLGTSVLSALVVEATVSRKAVCTLEITPAISAGANEWFDR
jgi:hypothetical protein